MSPSSRSLPGDSHTLPLGKGPWSLQNDSDMTSTGTTCLAPTPALTLWVPDPLPAMCLPGKSWGCWLSWLQGMGLWSELGCAEGAWMYGCCGVCFSEWYPELGQPWFAHRHRASAERTDTSLKLHHKPPSSTETLALLCLLCHPALSCMPVCPSAFPISFSSPHPCLPSLGTSQTCFWTVLHHALVHHYSIMSPRTAPQLLSVSSRRTTETGRELPGRKASWATGWGTLLKVYFHDAPYPQL